MFFFEIILVILRPDCLLLPTLLKIIKMKKYLLIATVALGMTLVACGGGQKTENANNATTPTVTAAPVDTTQKAQTADTSAVAPVDTTAVKAK